MYACIYDIFIVRLAIVFLNIIKYLSVGMEEVFSL
jgi:hypothetical protein